MSQENHRTVSSQFLQALILAGLSACQQVALQPSEPPASQNSQASARSAPMAFENRTASIVVEREEGNRYKLSWPTIPGAAYYKLFLDGELLKEHLKTSQYQMDISQLSWGIHKLGYEAFDRNNRFMSYLAQEWDLKPLLPKPPELNFPPCPTIGYLDLDPWVNKYCLDGKLYESPSEKNFIEGHIYTDTHTLLAGTKISLRLFENSHPFVVETISTDGTYRLDNIPTGFKVEIFATKPGFTTRRRIEVVKSKGQPNENRYDFGTEGENYTFSAPYNGLSDKPEVIQVTPARNGSGLDPKTDFILQFSQPMDRQSVEDTFTVRSFKNHKLSVDNTINKFPSEMGFKYTLHGNGLIASNAESGIGTPIYDASAFDISWNADDTQVTFQFKPGLSLPTDKTPELAPHYQVAFKPFTNKNLTLRDKTGVERKEKHFKLTDGNFEEGYKFQVKEDQQAPSLQAARWAGFSGQMPTLLLQYSEPMLLKTYSMDLAGGMADELPSCKQAPAGFPWAKACTASKAAENYQVKITAPSGALSYQGTWANLGGEASYASWDASFRTIVLSTQTSHPTFVSGAHVEIIANPEIVDPAGNTLSHNQTPLKVSVP